VCVCVCKVRTVSVNDTMLDNKAVQRTANYFRIWMRKQTNASDNQYYIFFTKGLKVDTQYVVQVQMRNVTITVRLWNTEEYGLVYYTILPLGKCFGWDPNQRYWLNY